MSWKKLIFGERMPDKDAPENRERYERHVETGRQLARVTGLGTLAVMLQRWGQAHKVAFIVIVFSFVVFCFFLNAYRLFVSFQQGSPRSAVAVERVDSALQERKLLSE